MNQVKIIDVEHWERQELYHFFRHYDDPFFSVTVTLDVTALLQYTRENQFSFFAAYLYASQQMVQRIPEFRYRIKGDQILLYAEIQAGSTVLKTNHLFTFCYFHEQASFSAFNAHVREQISRCRQATTPLIDHDHDLAQIHYSVLPWIHFQGLSHPRNHGTDDSIPKIVFGQYQLANDRYLMPVAVAGHHALMDGYHAGLYFEGFQRLINDPQTLLGG